MTLQPHQIALSLPPSGSAKTAATPTTDCTLDIASLSRGLESLPQELYDMVYTEVFTARSGTYHPILRTEIPHPAQNVQETPNREDLNLLHVSRASRELYAKNYYSEPSEFVFQVGATTFMKTIFRKVHCDIPFCRWREKLPVVHLACLPRVILEEKRDDDIRSHTPPIANAWLAKIQLIFSWVSVWIMLRMCWC